MVISFFTLRLSIIQQEEEINRAIQETEIEESNNSKEFDENLQMEGLNESETRNREISDALNLI